MKCRQITAKCPTEEILVSAVIVISLLFPEQMIFVYIVPLEFYIYFGSSWDTRQGSNLFDVSWSGAPLIIISL